MSNLVLSCNTAHSQPGTNESPEATLRQRVLAILAAQGSNGRRFERRATQRYAFPHLIRLTALAKDGETLPDESYVVVGTHLSERGLGFFHPQPLPHRRVVAELEAGNGHGPRCAVVLELNWCRFTHHGWYESGGRFLHLFTPTRELPSETKPLAAVADAAGAPADSIRFAASGLA